MHDPAADGANTPLHQPSRLNTAAHGERRVGAELEFAGLGIEQIATTLKQVMGGKILRHSAYEYTIADTDFGDFAAELDYAYLKTRGRAEIGDGFRDEMERLSDDLLGLNPRPRWGRYRRPAHS